MSQPPPAIPHLPAVLLRHALPDGSVHIDWLLAPAGGHEKEERVLMSWRLEEEDGIRLARDSGHAFHFPAIRMADHRAAYLAYEGEVGGGRGEVGRIVSGHWDPLSVSDTAIAFVVRFGSAWRVRGQRIGEAPEPADGGNAPLGLWRLTAEPILGHAPEAGDAPSG